MALCRSERACDLRSISAARLQIAISADLICWAGIGAGLVFTDGVKICAGLDRNGLRPSRYALFEDGLLYIEVSTEDMAMGPGEVLDHLAAPPGPGHDPCLYVCPIDTQRARA